MFVCACLYSAKLNYDNCYIGCLYTHTHEYEYEYTDPTNSGLVFVAMTTLTIMAARGRSVDI